MIRLRVFIHRLRGMFLKRRRERELEDELRAHLEMQIEENVRQGMSPGEARREAQRKFGGVEQVKEAYRDRIGLPLVESTLQDLRYAARTLAKKPGFSLIAIITLAMGIGANTTIFSIANTILLQPLPIKDADRIVDVRRIAGRDHRPTDFSYPDYLELRKRAGEAVDLFAVSREELDFGASDMGGKAMVGSEVEELRGLLVTGTYFSALGGNALLGRTLTPEDDQVSGAHPVVLLSHGFWQRRFGAAPDIVGQTILLNGRSFTVVGVAEASFRGVAKRAPDVWLPLLMRDQLNTGNNQSEMTPPVRVTGRLKPGVSLRQAEAALTIAYTQLMPARSGGVLDPQIRTSPPQMPLKLYPASLLDPGDRPMIMTIMSVTLGAVTLVLLIACLNVAGLMLVRLSERQREIAVRLSLGASRLRLLRQLFTESLLLAVAGGLAGLLLSRWVAQGLGFLVDEFANSIALDWRVIAYTLGISVFVAVVVGLLPAWQTTRFDLVSALKQEGAGFNQSLARFHLRSALVVGQIALSLVLLLGAGLFARTLLHLMTIDPGFETKNLSVVELRIRAPGSLGYNETRATQFQQALQERLVATPMVKDAVWVGRIPLSDGPFSGSPRNSEYSLAGSASIVNADGRTGTLIRDGVPRNSAASNEVSPNYFAALGIPLLYGRAFTEQETRDEAAVVVINESLQRRHWPGQNPVGKSLISGDRKWEIVGVAKDTRNTLRNAANEPYLFLPLSLTGRSALRLLVRSDAAPGALAVTLRTTIWSLDPKLRINVRQFEDMLKREFEPLRVGTSMASLFGILALALAVMGLYGVTAFTVIQRTHEIGVRMALGAQAANVVRLVLRQGLRLVIIGVAIGLLISVAATRVLAAALFGISPTDPLTFGAIALLLGFVSLLACWIPARRATKVDPLVALRYE
jgi:predicted permease